MSGDDAEDFTEATARMLDGVWAICRDLGFCPICMVELMYDMVTNAEAAGHIKLQGKAPEEDDEPEPTHEGPCTHQ